MAKHRGLRAIALGAFAVAAAGSASIAHAQTTGVSHPDEIPVTTSPEGIAQPVVYEAPSAVVVVPATPVIPVADPAAHETEAPVMHAAMAPPSLPSQHGAATAVAESSVAAQDPEIERERVADRRAELTARAEEDPDAGIVTRVPGPSNQIPVGAMLRIRLRQQLDTKSTAPGTVFTATLVDEFVRDGRVLLPAGSSVHGKVTEVHGGKRFSGIASIHLQPISVTLPDGTRYLLRAQVIDSSMYKSTKVDDEGTIERKDRGRTTLAALGLATGAGAATGAVLGGWPGAIVGGVVGAGVSTVVWLRQDRQAELPVGTEVVISLTSPLKVGAE